MMLTGVSHHLWQSTLFALLAGLLTVGMRRERARVRYWVWMAASVKLLIPFAWLGALGSQFGRMSGVESAPGRLHVVIQVMAGPASDAVVSGLASKSLVLGGIWLCGLAAVVVWWCVRWGKVSRAIGDAASLQDGREVQTLRYVEGKLRIPRPIEIVRSTAASEPGVFGIARPVLMWPEGISQHLSDEELEAIVTHEVQHVRRRDNLTGALHMLVEAIFWFHPLVWWLGARLVDERERACDEDVLALGSKPRAYAEGILKVCEFCLASPLVCMSGVAGGDLKKRMVSIMTNRVLDEIGMGKKLMLGLVALVSIAGPIAVGTVRASETRSAPGASNPMVASTEQGPEHVQASKKEMLGLIVKKVNPIYPEAARKGKIQGEVILRATIGKTGSVENLQVMSGPAELAPAAVEAVKQWKYRPYMKEGKAVEVETDITVNFTLAE